MSSSLSASWYWSCSERANSRTCAGGRRVCPASNHPSRVVTVLDGSIEEVMPRLLHRHCKLLTSAVLGLWMFALFVGIGNACSWDGVTAVPHQPTVAGHAGDAATDHGLAADCDEFCSNDVPLLGVLQLVQEQPAGQPLVVATHHDLGFVPTSAPVLRLARTAHPSPGVPFSLRIVRLRL